MPGETEWNVMAITGRQLAAARSMLGWGHAELAKKARVSVSLIRRMESYAGEAINGNAESLLAIVEALKTGGVHFIEGGVQVAQVIAIEDPVPEAKPKTVRTKIARSPKE
jgi:predicted transcriptional regulator